MGKSFRQRVKKRKQDRAKHSRPTWRDLKEQHQQKRNTLAPSSSNANTSTNHKKSPPVATRPSTNNSSSLTEARVKRSPVLSRYLDPDSHVLIVGDGDFSFGRALAQMRSQQTIEGGSLTVTGYDTRAEALKKYGNPNNKLSTSKKKGKNKIKSARMDIEQSLYQIEQQKNSRVLHSIDATKLKEQLTTTPNNNNCNYDVVVFNFPHSGEQRVHINRNLMQEFFQSVRSLFLTNTNNNNNHKRRKARQAHVTIKNQRPYIHWNIEASAKEAGFAIKTLNGKVQFDMALWNSLGYRHQTTVGPQQATSQPQLLATNNNNNNNKHKHKDSEAKLAQTWIFEFQQDLVL